MSLHIGNLSARTRGDELKRVFGRFGRCSIQLKDGYGFVVYAFVQDAEKALRALQGRYICGEPLTLTWSKKQPKPFQRHPRGVRSYESQCGRNFAWRDHGSRKSSHAWRDQQLDNKQSYNDGLRRNSMDMLDVDRDHLQEDVKDYNQEPHDLREGLPVDGDTVEPKIVDTGRWGDQVHDASNANGVDAEVAFDRYEPYQDHDRKDEEENHYMAYPGGGSAPRSSQENVRRDLIIYSTQNHSNDLRLQNTCFSCGGLGHKIRNCPTKHSSARKFTRFDQREDDAVNRGEAKLERSESRSSEKLQLSKDNASRHRNHRTENGSGNHQRLTNNGNSPGRKKSGRTEIKDHRGKKRRGREGEAPKRHSGKRARRPVSSSLHSDSPASKSRSRSTSQSSKSMSRSSSRSRSRSVSSGAHSQSSHSRSSLKSKSCKHRSRSRSSSSTSWPVSVSQSPPNMAHRNFKASVYNTNVPKSKEILVEDRQPLEGDACIENADNENAMAVAKSNYVVSGFEVRDDIKLPLQRNAVDENHTTSGSILEVTNPGTPLPEIGAHTAGSLSPEGVRDMLDLKKSGAPVMGHLPPQAKEPASETPVNCSFGRSTCISPDEMCRVSKHYGLELPEESEHHLSIEDYFGSARLWPWEIIYYRRLKKGLISIENYARRVAQNEEFGIVDKYIRSSSGLGEIDLNKP